MNPLLAASSLFVCLTLAGPLYAEEAPPVDVERARQLFVEGAGHASEMRWSDALGRFEASAKLHPHAGTSYNIGVCQRSLGQYLLARKTFERALREDVAAGNAELPDATRANIAAYLEEIARVLATVEVSLSPASAAVAVDGRPLERALGEGPARLIAGTRPAGPGEAAAGRFELLLDPGAHVFVLSRKGYADAVVRRSLRPGENGKLDLRLERLPGTLHVAASEERAAVAIDGVDVGLAPIEISRPPGRYHVLVQKDGFESYQLDVTVPPAERIDLEAPLVPEEEGVHEQWWFWASIGGALATAATITYFVAQPEPERPPLDGGGLGWTIRVP